MQPPTRPPASPWYRSRRGIVIAAAPLVLVVLGVVGAWWGIRELTGIGCSSGERAAMEEFPHYGDRWIRPYSGEVSCNARYTTDGTREQVLGYYDERLRENGWQVRSVWAADPPRGIEVFGEQPSDISEAPEWVRSGLGARRGDYSYGVTYHPPGESPEESGEEAMVLVEVSDEPGGGFPKGK